MSCGRLWLILFCYILPRYVTFIAAHAPTQQIDYSLVCKPGYRVSKIQRSPDFNGKLGALNIQCELIERNGRQVECARLQSIPQCSGVAEGCSGQTWLAGFHLYVIENSTKTTLWDPICCTSRSTTIDENSCINDRLNQPNEKFEHEIAGDLVYRGLQCWHQYNDNNTLFDLVWKMEICPFSSAMKKSHRPLGCPECECDCGKARCPDNSYPAKLIHKYPQKQSCQCRCDCTTVC